MNRNRARSEKSGQFRPYIIDKTKTTHRCDTCKEYIKIGQLAAYQFNLEKGKNNILKKRYNNKN